MGQTEWKSQSEMHDERKEISIVVRTSEIRSTAYTIIYIVYTNNVVL